jgi:hypothetical protein
MSQLVGKRITLGATGSIAAYKAADLTSQLVKYGAEVQVVMTKGATQFITPMTLQVSSRRPVAFDLWAEGANSVPGHIEIADSSDLLLVAPLSANVLAKFAHGLGPRPADQHLPRHPRTSPPLPGDERQDVRTPGDPRPTSRPSAVADTPWSSRRRACWRAVTRASASWRRSKRS